MDARDHERAKLIVALEIDRAWDDMSARVESIRRQQAAKGMLGSGNTIDLIKKEHCQTSSNLFLILEDKLLEISRDLILYEYLCAAVREFFTKSRSIVNDDFIGRLGIASSDGIRNGISSLYDKHSQELERQLTISRYKFDTKPNSEPASLQPMPQNKGGRPVADFWNDLWASIAADLFNGDLNPKSQADIERAMFDWLTGHGHNAAQSTVRLRARRLWKLIRAT